MDGKHITNGISVNGERSHWLDFTDDGVVVAAQLHAARASVRVSWLNTGWVVAQGGPFWSRLPGEQGVGQAIQHPSMAAAKLAAESFALGMHAVPELDRDLMPEHGADGELVAEDIDLSEFGM